MGQVGDYFYVANAERRVPASIGRPCTGGRHWCSRGLCVGCFDVGETVENWIGSDDIAGDKLGRSIHRVDR